MPVKHLRFVLLSLVLTLPGMSFAASTACDQGSLCDTQVPSKAQENTEVQTQNASSNQDVQTEPEAEQAIQEQANPPEKLKSIAELIDQLDLSKEQSLVLYDVVKQQIPEVSESRKNIDKAQATLRNMAINKQFDETVINILAKTIAENTANLAVLQVQREYEALAILTPEQIRRYQDLTHQ